MEYQRDANLKGFMKITDRVQRKTHIRSHLWEHIWPNSTCITWNQVQCVLPLAEPGVWNKSIGN